MKKIVSMILTVTLSMICMFSVAGCQQKPSDKELFETYRQEQCDYLDSLQQSNNTHEIQILIMTGKNEVKSVAWDESKSLEENKAILDNVVNGIKKKYDREISGPMTFTYTLYGHTQDLGERMYMAEISVGRLGICKLAVLAHNNHQFAGVVGIGEIQSRFTFFGGAHAGNDGIQIIAHHTHGQAVPFGLDDHQFHAQAFGDHLGDLHVIAVSIAHAAFDGGGEFGFFYLGPVEGSIVAFHAHAQLLLGIVSQGSGGQEHHDQHHQSNDSGQVLHVSFPPLNKRTARPQRRPQLYLLDKCCE